MYLNIIQVHKPLTSWSIGLLVIFMSEHPSELTPQHASDRAEQIGSKVRGAARWHGWVWVVIAIITPIFWLGTREGGLPRPMHFWVALGFCALGLLLVFWERRRGVIGRHTARLDRPVTVAYVGAMFVVALVVIFWEPRFTPAFIALAALPSVPCVIAAWRVLRG